MTTEQLQVNFRMPADLKAQLEQSALKSQRSLTAEIVHRLRESFGSADVTGKGDAMQSPLPLPADVARFTKQMAEAQQAMARFTALLDNNAYTEQAEAIGRQRDAAVAQMAGQPSKPKGK